jgi:putative salt-induced outer membrane protein YdiY
MNTERLSLIFLLLLAMPVSRAFAQNPTQAPVEIWSGSVGAGFFFTTGNSATSNLNLSFDVVRDPKRRNLIKFSGLYLRGKENDILSKDRIKLNFSDEYTISGNTFFFGTLGYLRDTFKEIEYLINPSAGIGYRLWNTERTQLNLSGGLGAVWERNPGMKVDASGTINMNQEFILQLSENARLTQDFSSLLKTGDFGDDLYHFGIALSASVIKNMELKVEFQNDYKTIPPNPETKKNDTATLLSLVFKF